MNETKIYVGLNDSESMKQEHETEKFVKILKNVCYNYHVAFSFSVVQGGYFHEDGEYTQETTLVLTLIDTDNETVNEIAKDLCVFFHQESVMITESKVRAYFINERL
ncbi:MAG: DUF3574 domain-containing protein [Erysipelotrichaceae bacterium]|nr:DUF3574 domain-containing protein [Erysipelotrichaceae bacterium]